MKNQHFLKPIYRNAFKIFWMLCLIYSTSSNNLFAQSKETRSIYSKIIFVDSSKGKIVVVINTPFIQSLKTGTQANVVTKYSKEDSTDIDESIGWANCLLIRDSLAGFLFYPNEKGTARGIREGDLLSISITDSVFYPNDFISNLLAQEILLKDQYKEPFYNPLELAEAYKKDRKKTEKWLVDTFYTDLKTFYEDSKEIFEGETFITPLEKGRYKGRTIKEIFENLKREDIEAYLRFIISFPGKYIGIPYKVNETFATWLVNFSPSGGHEIIHYYHEANGDSLAFAKKMKSLPDILHEKGISYSTGLVANNHRYWSESLSDDEYKAAIWFSELSGDYSGAGLVYLFKAEQYQNRQDYPPAFLYCKKAEKIYSAAKNYDRLLDLYFKQSYLNYNTSAYDSSVFQLSKAKIVLENYLDSLEDYSPEEGWSKYYDYMSFTYYKAGRYIESLNYMDSSFVVLKDFNNQKSTKSKAFNQKVKGNIFKAQESYDKAYEAYKTSSELYASAGEKNSSDDLMTDIGIILFKQGKYLESNKLLKEMIPVYEESGDQDNIGLCFSQIGQNFWNLAKYDSAILSHSKAIDIRRKTGNRSGQAFSWEQLGTLYQKAGFKDKALASLDTAARIYEEIGDRAEAASLLKDAAKVYQNDKEIKKAEEYLKKASNTLAALGNQAEYADALFELGLLVMENNPDESIIYMDSCRMISKEAGLKTNEAYSMMNLGGLYKGKGKITEGKKWYEEAKNIILQLNEPHAMGHYYRSLGRDAEWDLNLEAANGYYEKAIQIFDSTDRVIGLQLRNSLANNYQNMGNYPKADTILEDVLTRAKEGNFMLEIGSVYQNKAWMLLQQGQTAEGLRLADSAAHYYDLTGNTNSIASIYALRGDLNRKTYNFNEAFRWYSKSDSIFAASNNPWAHSSGMINFVVLYYYQGDYQKSLDYTYKALATRPFLLEDALYLDLQASLAEIFYYLHKTDSSLQILDKYLPIAKQKKLIRAHNWLSLIKGRLLVDEKKYAEAIPLLMNATDAISAKNDLIIYQQALAYLGLAYSGTQKQDSANRYFNLAVKTANTFEIPSFSWEALYLAGLDAYNNNQYEKAIPLFKQSVNLVNKQASNLYGGEEAGKLFKQQTTKSDLYFKLMSALTKTGRKEEAWQYANLSQSAALSDLAGGLSAEMANPEKQKALQEAQEKFQQLQTVGNALQESKKDSLGKAGQIVVLQKTQAIAETEYLNYIEKLKKDFPELGTFFANQVNPEKFRNLHTYLDEDMAMVMYVVNDKELMIFWATQDNTGIVTGTIPDDFFKQAEAWIASLKNPNRPANAGPLVLRTQIGKVPGKSQPTMDVKTGAEQFYQLLIAPVLPEIKDKTSWCIIPNGELTHLPFHAMGTKNANGNFEYIAATKNIFYTNNPNELFLPWNRRNKKNFAAFGNPDKTLQSAGDEVNQIAKVYTTANVYTEDKATVEQATQSLSTMHYVHFATHGVLNYNDFDSSYLVFAPEAGNANKGHLSLYDIRRMDIKGCDLVTLSACETAVSAQVSKGWYISPANAFLINRVRSVIASLWEVDDKSTSLLMQHFYDHLQTHNKTEALRMAMADISAMPGYEHPFYWAGFVLYGDWQ